MLGSAVLCGGCARLGCAVLCWAGLGWAGLGWAGLGAARHPASCPVCWHALLCFAMPNFAVLCCGLLAR